MRNYMKKKNENSLNLMTLSADELISRVTKSNFRLSKRTFVFIGMLLVPAVGIILSLNKVGVADNFADGAIGLASAPMSAASASKDVISIPEGIVKANPFLPYRDISGNAVSDVPNFELIEPPEMVNVSSDAARVMDTIVSGILYDKFSPSAILNIEGNDYLVKKGDTVNNYKVLSITQDSVTVKLGANTYQAGIGEILTEGTVNYNNVSNLSNKFGGERR